MLLSIPAGLPISQDHPHHLPLSLSSELLVLMFLSSCSCSVHASHNFFDRPDPSAQRMPPAHHQQLHSLGFVHTFETSEQCESNCPRPCVQILEELEMMPRWVCDPQNFEQVRSCWFDAAARPARPPKVHPRNLGSSSPLDGSDQQSGLLALVHNQLLLIIVPAAFFAILCIIILLRRCTSSASMATI